MKDRLITAAGAVAALLLLYVMFFQSAEAPVTRPISTETGRNGYAAVSAWLERGGVPVGSLRQRFDALIARDPSTVPLDYPRRGNVLITTMPHLLPVRSREHESLKAWVRSGNTLLILAALNDTPEWTPQNDRAFLEDLQIMSGMRFVARSAGEAADSPPRGPAQPVPAATPVELEPIGGHPLMDGVETLRGYSDAQSSLWEPMPWLADELLLRFAVERSSGTDAAWHRAYGNGHIITVASGTLLTNHLVAAADAGRFLANIVRHHLEDGGSVIFDDMHQGLSVIYDAAAFYRDSRLHHTLWFLIGAWLVYLLGSSNRLAPPHAPRDTPRQRDFLEAVGGFMARRIDPRDAGLLLMESWFDEVRRAHGVQAQEPPWDELLATPTLGRETYERLRRYHETLKTGRPVDLVRLHNTLRSAREAIG